MIAGEEEAKSGMVDIRTRDNKRLGKMRVDELHAHFESLMPKNSSKYEKFYEKAWDPSQFNAGCCTSEVAKPKAANPAKVDSLKVHVDSIFSKEAQLLQVVADLVGSKLELLEAE